MKQIKQLSSLALLTIAVFIFGIAKTNGQSKKITVTLRDSITNLPLSNVPIDINRFENNKYVKMTGVTTDENGTAAYLAIDSAQKYQVLVKKEGYLEKRAYAGFSKDEKNDTFVRFRLKMSRLKP